MLKNGSRGDDVRALQTQLNDMGFGLEVDGIFGSGTDAAIKQLQTMFGYTVDGIVGPGTLKLIDVQKGLGWNVTHGDAEKKALQAQGKWVEPAKGAIPEKGGPPGTKGGKKK